MLWHSLWVDGDAAHALGWDFALPDRPGVPVDSPPYLELLRTHSPARFDWHAEAAEHVFSYQDRLATRMPRCTTLSTT